MKQQQSGGGILEGILIFLAVVIVAVVGWYVYQARNNTIKTLQNTSKGANQGATKKSATTPATDPTASWTKYSNAKGNYSLKHPASWIEASHPELCVDGLVLLGPSKDTVGACGSDSGGQMSVWCGEAITRKDSWDNGYTGVSSAEVTVDSVKGKRTQGSTMGQQGSESLLGTHPDGTKVVEYTFDFNNRSCTARYVQEPSSPDVLNDFDTMITKTLKFSA